MSTDRLAMTIAVDMGRKATKQSNKQPSLAPCHLCDLIGRGRFVANVARIRDPTPLLLYVELKYV